SSQKPARPSRDDCPSRPAMPSLTPSQPERLMQRRRSQSILIALAVSLTTSSVAHSQVMRRSGPPDGVAPRVANAPVTLSPTPYAGEWTGSVLAAGLGASPMTAVFAAVDASQQAYSAAVAIDAAQGATVIGHALPSKHDSTEIAAPSN